MQNTRCVVDIGALIGGEESHRLVEMLLEKYRRWAERCGHVFEVLDTSEAFDGALKSVKFTLCGIECERFAMLHQGVHVMVRTPPGDLNQRRHMCAAGVRVCDDKDLPLPQEMKGWGDEIRRYVFDPEPAVIDARAGRFQTDPAVIFDGDFSMLERG